MFNWLKKFFKQVPPARTRTAVYFDGEQTSSQVLSKLYRKDAINVDYTFFTTSPTAPKLLKVSSVRLVRVENIGKESTDTAIAMMAMKECCKSTKLKELVIVSSDGDFVGVLYLLAKQFPEIRFHLVRDEKKFTAKKAVEFMKKAPKNLTWSRVKT